MYYISLHYIIFLRSPQSFPLQVFLPMTFTTTLGVPALHSDSCHSQTLKSFNLLTYYWLQLSDSRKCRKTYKPCTQCRRKCEENSEGSGTAHRHTV